MNFGSTRNENMNTYPREARADEHSKLDRLLLCDGADSRVCLDTALEYQSSTLVKVHARDVQETAIQER